MARRFAAVYFGGLGFGFKWNMGWMHDFLHYMKLDPIFRRFHHNNITFSIMYAFQEHFILVLRHDEVVYGKGSLIMKMPGDEWQKFANLRMFYAWMYGHPGKKLLFMGGEFGQVREWNHDGALDWELTQLPRHDGLRRLVQHLNHVYRNEPALWNQDDNHESFEWIDFHDADNSVVSFFRRSREGDIVVFVVNATPQVLYNYRLGVPQAGYIARSSIPMQKPTEAATSAISAECRASRNHGWPANIPCSFICHHWRQAPSGWSRKLHSA